MLRPIIALATAGFVALAIAPTEASARPFGGGGGFHGGGFHGGGFHGGGFRGGFRGGGFGYRGYGPALGIGLGLGLAGAATYPYWGGGYYGYSGYGYADDCLVSSRVWTPYGWRVRLVNACY